jgi:hypothetical protein
MNTKKRERKKKRTGFQNGYGKFTRVCIPFPPSQLHLTFVEPACTAAQLHEEQLAAALQCILHILQPHPDLLQPEKKKKRKRKRLKVKVKKLSR